LPLARTLFSNEFIIHCLKGFAVVHIGDTFYFAVVLQLCEFVVGKRNIFASD
jgi:hypothetical protein